MRCELHCPPKASGAGGLVAVAAVLVAAEARPLLHAAVMVAEAVVIVLVSAAVLAVAVVVARAALRWHRQRAAIPAVAADVRALPAPLRAIEGGRVVQGEVIGARVRSVR